MDGGLNALFRSQLPKFHWQRIETGGVGLGVPDVNYCGASCEGWIEFKLAVGQRAGLRPEQIGWISQRMRAGGRVYIAVRRLTKSRDELWLYCGHSAVALADRRLNDVPPLGMWSGGPSQWDWKTIQRSLTSRCHRGIGQITDFRSTLPSDMGHAAGHG